MVNLHLLYRTQPLLWACFVSLVLHPPNLDGAWRLCCFCLLGQNCCLAHLSVDVWVLIRITHTGGSVGPIVTGFHGPTPQVRGYLSPWTTRRPSRSEPGITSANILELSDPKPVFFSLWWEVAPPALFSGWFRGLGSVWEGQVGAPPAEVGAIIGPCPGSSLLFMLSVAREPQSPTGPGGETELLESTPRPLLQTACNLREKDCFWSFWWWLLCVHTYRWVCMPSSPSLSLASWPLPSPVHNPKLPLNSVHAPSLRWTFCSYYCYYLNTQPSVIIAGKAPQSYPEGVTGSTLVYSFPRLSFHIYIFQPKKS